MPERMHGFFGHYTLTSTDADTNMGIAQVIGCGSSVPRSATTLVVGSGRSERTAFEIQVGVLIDDAF